MTTLRVVTIGQAPRPALEAEIAAAVPGLAVALEGALDGLTRTEIAALAPRDDADTLFTPLPSGEGVAISKAAVTERLRARLPAISGPVLLACTGAFKGLPERVDLVQPSAVLNALAGAILPRGRLGLAVPFAEQVATLCAERRRPGLEVAAVALRPGSDDAAREAAARDLAATRPDLVLLDCISYTRADKAAFAAVLGCPVLLSVAVAARAAACLLDG
ncbi:AroM family protein [Falsiroseomonas oryzae]|uniref:AroM family protein n=1 Tax=Falsiroseomonas oryzae TaxID=2766473 RepID=UPI0022EA537A|nr:AroM family protein [Roseomonas sp. MO-31]